MAFTKKSFSAITSVFLILTLNTHICCSNPVSDGENSVPDNTHKVQNFTQGLEVLIEGKEPKESDLRSRWDHDPSIADLFKCPGTGSLTEIVVNMKKMLEQSPDKILCISSKEYACTMLALINYNPEAVNTISSLKTNLKTAQEKVKSLSRLTTFNSNRLHELENRLDEKMNKTAQEFLEIQKMTEELQEDQTTISNSYVINENLENQIQTVFSDFIKKSYNTSANTLNSVLKTLKTKSKHLHQGFTELKMNIQDLNLRASAIEVEVSQKIEQIYSKARKINEDLSSLSTRNGSDIQQNCTTKQNQNSRNLEDSVTSMNMKYEMEMSTKKLPKIGDLFKEITQIRSDITLQLEDKFKSTEENQVNLRNIIDSQFKQLNNLESNCRAQLEREKLRAIQAEMDIMENYKNTTVTKESYQISLENEINRAIFAENNLHKLFSEQSEKFTTFEGNLRTKLNQEIERANSSEKNLSSIINTEITRAKRTEYKITQRFNYNISKIQTNMINELNRAQSAEEGLYHKISDEMSRAINAEAHLRANINDETRRASQREAELEEGIIGEVERFEELHKQIQSDFQHELKRAVTQEEELDTKFNNYEQRLHDVNERLKSNIDEKAKTLDNLQNNLRTVLDEEINRAKDAESGMLNTVTAGVTRAVEFENSLKEMISKEIDRSLKSDITVRKHLEENITKLNSKYESVTKLLESESSKMEGWTAIMTRNSTHHMLVMAQGLNQKYRKLHDHAYRRLDKVEEDLKVCCNSGWFRSLGGRGTRQENSDGIDPKMEMPDFGDNDGENGMDLHGSLVVELSKLDEADSNNSDLKK